MRFREPLLLPSLFLATGILAAHFARFQTLELGLAGSAFVALAVLSRFIAPRLTWLAAGCCMGIAGIAVAEFHRAEKAPVVDAEQGEVLLIAGCLVEPVSVRDGRGRMVVEIEDGARVTASFRAEDAAILRELEYGSVVEFPARVRTPRNYGNPGAFDYVGYLARRHTYWTATVSPKAEIKRVGSHCGAPWKAAIYDVRNTALARIDAQYPDSDIAGLMRALLLGDDDQLRPDTSDAFRRTGTYHALVISGLHISLIAGTILWILRRAFFPLWARLLISAAAAWVYTAVAAGEAPVMRAAVGFTLALVAAAVYRRARVLNLLAAVAMLFLLADPGQLFEASFQLSFAAVAAIGALAAPLIDRSSAVLRDASRTIGYVRPNSSVSVQIASLRVELRLLAQTVAAVTRMPLAWAEHTVGAAGRVLATASDMVILSAAVQFALAVPSVWYFHRVPVTSLAANLIAVPALNGAVGFGLAALLTGSTSLAGGAAFLAQIAQQAVAWFAAAEPDWRPVTPTLFSAIAFVVSLSVLAVAYRREWRLTPVFGAVAVSCGLWLCVYDNKPGRTGWLEVSAIDVGQGDSLLIVFPEGQTMLVDGGGFPTFRGAPAVRRMDIGEQVVSPYLWNRGLHRLDVVAMTHAHDDHAQGLEAIVRNFHPAELWTGALPEQDVRIVAQAKQAGVRVEQLRAGEIRRFGSATVRVLAPAPDYIPGKTAKNNDSLVMEIAYGRRRFLLTGDAEKAVESELVMRELLHPADVLKVAHHGSKSSSIPDLLAATRPAFAVISAGEGNLYNHPHPDILARLREFRVQAIRTDRAGLTQFRTDGKQLLIDTYWLDWRAD